MNSSSVSGHIINRGGGWNDPGYSLFLLSNTIRIELQRTGEKDIVDNGVSINAWLYVALTYNGTTNVIRCYIDGVQQGNTGNHTGPIGTPVENLNIGRKEQNAFYFDGIIDEGRVISAERNAEWMLTEYRNQNTPNSFYTKSVEYGAASLCWTLPVEFLDFAVKPVNNSDALVKWVTASESNNDYFVVQKSLNGSQWGDVRKIDGAGNSAQENVYSFIDTDLSRGVTYYRIKQVDFDGTIDYSEIKSIQITELTSLENLYPNPAEDFIIIKPEANEFIRIYDVTGQLQIETIATTSAQLTIYISSLAAGTYLVDRNSKIEKLIKY